MSEPVIGRGGLEKVVIQSAEGGSAEVYLHGAHVTSWRSREGEELLFMSSQAVYAPPQAIRGGIPVCFPQFSDMGPLGQHGFARNSLFAVLTTEKDSVTMVLRSDAATRKLWPFDFELTVKVSVEPDLLRQQVSVSNTGAENFSFTTALHSYFRVSNIRRAQVQGLHGKSYLDNLAGRQQRTDDAEAVQFEAELDRIYTGVAGTVRIIDELAKQGIAIRHDNYPDTVVWNPWVEKAKSTADLGDAEYQVLLCVEPAVAASGPIMCRAGQSWSGGQTLRLQTNLHESDWE